MRFSQLAAKLLKALDVFLHEAIDLLENFVNNIDMDVDMKLDLNLPPWWLICLVFWTCLFVVLVLCGLWSCFLVRRFHLWREGRPDANIQGSVKGTRMWLETKSGQTIEGKNILILSFYLPLG